MHLVHCWHITPNVTHASMTVYCTATCSRVDHPKNLIYVLPLSMLCIHDSVSGSGIHFIVFLLARCLKYLP